MIKFVLFVYLILPSLSYGANILGLMGGSSASHHNWNKVIFYSLIERGHNLTVLSPDIDDVIPPGLHYIHAEQVYPTLYTPDAPSIHDSVGIGSVRGTMVFYGFADAVCRGFFLSQGFQTLLNYPDDFKFDLILVDYIFEPCLLGFVHKFKHPPTITVNPFSIPSYIYDFIGGHPQPSYIPHAHTEFAMNMNLIERVQNLLAYMWEECYRKLIFIPQQEKALRIAFNEPTLQVKTLQKSIVLALTNTHFAVEKMEPLPPNVIPVGGLQIRDPKPLRTDIADFIESSQKGAVLFSLGSIVRSDDMNDTRKVVFIEAFKQFPEYNFIWKYESDIGIELPPNVRTFQWLNQNDILAHPKVKAFISHCGLLSTQEAIWYGVPVIGIPFYGDQFRNLRNGIREGSSLRLDYAEISVNSLTAVLTEILQNPKFLKNAKRRSKLFRDQPEKPVDRAIYWIEWTLRHTSDDYSAIQLPINDLGVVISNSYDVVIIFVLMILIVFKALLFLTLKLIGRKSKGLKSKND